MNGFVDLSATVEIVRLGYLLPRAVAVVLLTVYMYVLGWIGRRVLRSRRYDPVTRSMYILSVPLCVFGALYAALTL